MSPRFIILLLGLIGAVITVNAKIKLNILKTDAEIEIDFVNEEGVSVLKISPGVNLDYTNDCGLDCYEFGSSKMYIKPITENWWTIQWETTDSSTALEDCVHLQNRQWFGGPEQKEQYWPIQNLKLNNFTMVTKEDGNCAIIEPYWLSESGAYVYFNEKVPLFVDQNNKRKDKACFSAKIEGPYTRRNKLSFQYDIVVQSNAKTAHMHAVKHFLGKPTGIPNEKMFRDAIWSTWAKYKRDVNTTVVRDFANEILRNNFSGQFEIDDDWEVCYGALEFRKSKFENPKALVTELKKLGFRVTLWIHPFININCDPTFKEAKEKGYLVQTEDGQVETQWWNSGKGEASLVDFSNPAARLWWAQRLWKLKNETGLDSFKFDAGETSWAPQVPKLTGDVELQPNIFTKDYVNTCAQFGDLIEVRSAYRSQNLPIFVRIVDKDTKWGFDNGLRTLITTMLEMNMAGYPLVLPDMVGGNAYGDDKPTKDLFIRWLQANTFMPSIQFSLVPWDFDQETVTISRKFTELHEKYTDLIVKLAKQSVNNGTPLNPPIWWIDPTDAEALKINDEYLLGEDILVAPIVNENDVMRDIYLPAGKWLDGNTGKTIKGGVWVRKYPAPIDVLPYFIKQ